MSGELHDRVVVITGAGGGIGGACVRHMLAAGAKVVGADLDVTTSDLPHDSEHLRLTKVDLLDPSGAQTMIDFALDQFGRVDVLVNNAGVAPVRDSFLTTSDDDWALTLDLNLMGYVRASRAAIDAQARRRRRRPRPHRIGSGPDAKSPAARLQRLKSCNSDALESPRRGVHLRRHPIERRVAGVHPISDLRPARRYRRFTGG